MARAEVATRRGFIGGLGVGAIGVLAAACEQQQAAPAPAAQPPSEAGPAKAKGPVNVTILAPAGYLVDHPIKLLPIFHEKNPDIRVAIHHTAKMTEQVILRSISGDLEDIYTWWMGGQDPQVWFVRGITRAIDDLVKSHKVNPKDWYSATWNAHFVDGKQFSLPWQGQVFGFILYYNKNIFDEVGLSYPTDDWTIEDMIAAADKLRIVKGTKVERWGIRMGEDSFAHERFPGYVRAFDAELFSEDQRAFIAGETPEFLQALNWYGDMMQNRIGIMYSPGGNKRAGGPAKGLGRTYITMAQGKSAMVARGWLGATGRFAGFKKENPQFEYGAVLQPRGPTGRRGGWMTSASTNLNKRSKHPDEAFRFMIEFVSRDWSVARGLQTRGSTTLNGRPDVYHDKRLQTNPLIPKTVALTKAKAMDETETENCSYEGGGPWNFRVRDLWRLERQTLNKITDGTAPPSQDIVNELRRLMEPIMAMDRPGLGIIR